MACTECKRRNYQTNKSKRNSPDRLEFSKYCKWCGKHTLHRETREAAPWRGGTDSSPSRAGAA